MILKNNYINIRKSIGFIPYFFLYHKNEVKDVNIFKNIRILLLFTKKGYWDFPKGGMKDNDNDDYMTTALRELKEETGLTIKNIDKILKHKNFTYSYKVHNKKKNVYLYLCRLKPDVQKINITYDKQEIMFHEFVSIHELKSRFVHIEENKVISDIYNYFLKNVELL